MTEIRAEAILPTTDLRKDLPFFTKVLGLRLDMIYPADNPAVAVFSGHGLRVRLDQGLKAAPGRLQLLCEAPDRVADVASKAAAWMARSALDRPSGPKRKLAEMSTTIQRVSARSSENRRT